MREINKIKLEGNFCLKLEYEETVTSKDEEGNEKANVFDYTVTCRNEVHEDLVNALQNLRPHVLAITESFEPKSDLAEIPEQMLDKIEVTGISIGGSDEHLGVTIIAKRKLKHGKILNLTTPFQKYEDENMPYEFAGELYADVEQLVDEVQQYLNGKYAPSKQLELDL